MKLKIATLIHLMVLLSFSLKANLNLPNAKPLIIDSLKIDTLIITTSNYEFKFINFCSDNKSTLISLTKLKVPLSVIKESEIKKISRDVVYIEFKIDTNCRLQDIIISKKGILNSYTLFIESICQKLYNEILKREELMLFECSESICNNSLRIKAPVRLSLQ
jgi:hypothetical protein